MTGVQTCALPILIIVCDPHVIIFSEKTIAWPNGVTELAWSRWYKRAIEKSANQIRGAERWIRDLPSEIYLDPDCTIPFPIEFPSAERMIVHRVVVARGAGAACREHFGGGNGSLMLAPGVKGREHYKGDSIRPFVVGDRSEEHTSELQSLTNLVCRLLLEKKKNTKKISYCKKTKVTHLHHTT